MKNRESWFSKSPLGYIFHWGVYSAAKRGEWVLNRERLSLREYYQLYGNAFTANDWDPGEWMDIAVEGGASYVILTARHHDGFCLWPTKTTQWSVENIGPEKDIVGEFISAARSRGLRVGLYYSLADWSHPLYPSAWERDWPIAWKGDNSSYIEYCNCQLTELLTRYGKIDYLWYDGAFPQPMGGKETNLLVKKLQPEILINERNGAPFDIRISEQGVRPKEGLWEAVITLNNNWGFHATDTMYKRPEEIIRTLLSVRAEGGSLLINIGPKEDGKIPREALNIVKDVGSWMKEHGSGLYEVERSIFSWNNSVVFIAGKSCVNLYILGDLHKQFRISEFVGKPLFVEDVKNQCKVAYHQDDKGNLYLIDAPKTEGSMPVALRIVFEDSVVPITPLGNYGIPD